MNRLFQLTTLLLFFLISCKTPNTKTDSLRNKIEQIISGKNAVVGVSIIGNNGKDTLSINADKQFPMQSVFKFHIALAVLSEVDKGTLSLDQIVKIDKDDLWKGFWSPLRDENPNGGNFTIEKLIQYNLSHSDNTACDVLIRLIGTPKTVEEYIKKSGIEDIQITFDEKGMQEQWENMFQNWTTPNAANQTMKTFFENKNNLLSKSNYDFFWKTNKETTTALGRIRGQLPEEVIVAHKSGSSGTNKETGIMGAVNNIGIVFLPDGKYFYISVFITNSHENNKTNDKIIADIAKATYDFYTIQTK
ncbi:class A beta-lactamase, subclass A2 [Flavivirga algicola]|uniref:Beta-lactamase n=1 Tax=Flavivirga algicola TaxID=2729136 RepID=A0ABX1RUU2_9FLAO|nr:class A beta-lactamase, subclass A2 [Flavivirga algicola]NMH87312.1 class A beta-lactamase, subclass A2 [Flavivirga algicola]